MRFMISTNSHNSFMCQKTFTNKSLLHQFHE